jgi:hypothetical protein
VHAHQVLPHLTDPVGALREMSRVCRPGGWVAVRDADYAAMTWYPADPVLVGFRSTTASHAQMALSQTRGDTSLPGRMRPTSQTSSPPPAPGATHPRTSETGGAGAGPRDRSSRRLQALDYKLATSDELAEIAEAFQRWARHEDGWFSALSGEILCRTAKA